MRRFIIGLFSVAVLVILFFVLCTFVRRPYETVLLNRFGELIECSDATKDKRPPIFYNLYFKLPTDSVERIDKRLHLEQTTLQQVVTRTAKPLAVRTFVAWKIADPIKFYKTTSGSDDQARGIIGRKISGLVQAKVASRDLDEMFNKDADKVLKGLEAEIAREATKGSQMEGLGTTSGVEEQGIEIVQVGFSRMAFPPGNAQAVYDRMSSERNKQAQGYRAEGEALLTRLKAEGEAEAAIIRGEAVKEAEQIRGEGEKDANKILADVQMSQAAREFYQYWKSLEFIKTALTKNTYIVLPTDSDWLKALFTAPKQGEHPAEPTAAKPAEAGLPKVNTVLEPTSNR